MRSDDLVDRVRKAADIGTVAAWPDFTDNRILQELTERHCSMMADEEVRARAGYGVQTQTLTTVIGNELYPMPARAIGGAIEKLEIQLSGQTKWTPLNKLEVSGSEAYDLGTTQPGTPEAFVIRDGFVQLIKSPNAAYPLRFTFYIRPSQIVASQSPTDAGEGTDRGRITGINVGARTVTVNSVPFDMLLVAPGTISSGRVIDIVRPKATYALAMFSQTQTLAGTTFTLTSTDSMARVQIGDYVRAEDQTDWPMGLPAEFHRMVANRAAAEIARDIGVEEKVRDLASVVQADLERFRATRNPQVKSQPKVIPLVPMWARGRRR
jgi:hypothetical protein